MTADLSNSTTLLKEPYNIVPKEGLSFVHNFSFTQEQLFKYAEISGDTNPIHVSEEYSYNTNFGKCIVHGFFSISVFSKVYGTLLYPDGHILLQQNAKYLKPIFTNVDYIAYFKLVAIDTQKNRSTYQNCIYDSSGEQLLVIGESILLNKEYYK